MSKKPRESKAGKGKGGSATGIDPRFETLVRELDRICGEGPAGSRYDLGKHKGDVDKIHQARSRALVHLYLLAKYGQQDFTSREKSICDGSGDGGVDGYHIDDEKKQVLLVQSKLPAVPGNTAPGIKSVGADDLIKMEIGRILAGHADDSHGVAFNGKILELQKELKKRPTSKYTYKVVFLGNFKPYTDAQVKKLTDGHAYEILSYDQIYEELLFPVCDGVYFDPKEIVIRIDVGEKDNVHVDQHIVTKHGKCRVGVIFVPTKDVGAALSKYKNAILQYNPRNYLSLKKESVNDKIRGSIEDTEENDFAVLNNGITVLCKGFTIQENTGQKDVHELLIEGPQIINGGQTAYTLSKLYEQHGNKTSDIFAGKEVMLRIVLLDDAGDVRKFVEDISGATNNQSKVLEADRRSNDEIQIEVQKWLFKNFGVFYERKRGEYEEMTGTVILKRDVVPKIPLAKATLALKGKASEARGRGQEKLFQEDSHAEIFKLKSEQDFLRMYFAYRVSAYLDRLDKKAGKKDRRSRKYGDALRYGKMAVVAAVGHRLGAAQIKKDDLESLALSTTDGVLADWVDFEKKVKADPKRKDYFKSGEDGFDNYYKQDSANKDIEAYFKP